MLDLDAIEARAEAATPGHARADIPALVAELRAAREVVEAAHKWKNALTWDAEWSIRPAEVGSTLQRKSELLEALAAPAGAHVLNALVGIRPVGQIRHDLKTALAFQRRYQARP